MSDASGPLTEASAAALELPSLLAIVAELAATDLGRARLLALRPEADPSRLEGARRRFEEAAELLAEGALVQGFEVSLEELRRKLGSRELDLTGSDLLLLASVLEAMAGAARRIRDREPPAPALRDLVAGLPDCEPLRRRIRSSLDRRGGVRDDATPKLAGLRRRIGRTRDGLYGELRQAAERYREHLSEDTVPLHGGRLVLLLQAGARGRVKGLVHGGSASGKSLYFEPLEVLDANNRLQELIEQDGEERKRILDALIAAAREGCDALEAHFELAARLDALQAACRFGRLCGGRLAEIAEPGELRLAGARHPLLDPRLADLRRSALGQPGHTLEAVPLDLELDAGRRVLAITGPNAGGKTVALKTVGLLALANLCGLPVPAEAGTRLPALDRVAAAVGDEQDLLADRSTFSGRLSRLQEAWEAAAPGTLVLVDELGSGTDPEEGAALAIALLEGLLEKGALAVLTTHLTPLAAAALERPGAACAAMEFDPESGRPTFRLRPGSPGGSEAIALARRLGLPAAWLDRAEELLGRDHRDLRRLLAEVEGVRRELADSQKLLERELRSASDERERLERLRQEAEEERKKLAPRLRRELDAFRSEVSRRLVEEIESLRRSVAAGRRKGLAAESTRRLFAEEPRFELVEEGADLPVEVGSRVRHRGLGWEGVVESLDRSQAEVSVRGKRLRCAAADLVALAGGAAPKPARSAVSVSEAGDEAPPELKLIGRRVEPALEELDAYLDRALLAARAEVRIVHGHGSGRLRRAVRAHLRGHPAVAWFRPGNEREGGDGATVVALLS